MRKESKRKTREKKRKEKMDKLAGKIEARRSHGNQSSRFFPEWNLLRWLLFPSASSAVGPRERRDSASIVATEIQRVVRLSYLCLPYNTKSLRVDECKRLVSCREPYSCCTVPDNLVGKRQGSSPHGSRKDTSRPGKTACR